MSDPLGLTFGIVGVVSLIFSIYAYYATAKKKSAEVIKQTEQKDRIAHAYNEMAGVLYTIDMIVHPQQPNVTVSALQNLARTARGQAYVVRQSLDEQRQVLKDWKFGELTSSKSKSGSGGSPAGGAVSTSSTSSA